MRSFFKRTSLAVAICACLSSARAEEDWGTLTGKFVLDGDAPKAVEVVPTKDPAFCGKHKIFDESLVVGKDGGIKHVVVSLYVKAGTADKEKPKVHPSYDAAAEGMVELANKGCVFVPHVVLLRTTQKLLLTNPDAVAHNTKIDCFKNQAINPLIPPLGSMEHTFGVAENLAVPVGCNIHPWMKGWVLIKDNPYFAVTDDQGAFTIKNVPAGNWTFVIWQEKSGYIEDVTTPEGKAMWKFGRITREFSNGATVDLGTVKVSPKEFEEKKE